MRRIPSQSEPGASRSSSLQRWIRTNATPSPGAADKQAVEEGKPLEAPTWMHCEIPVNHTMVRNLQNFRAKRTTQYAHYVSVPAKCRTV